MIDKTRILFVCLGNIVRSPLAENMYRHLAEQAGVGDLYEVDFAGTGAYHIGEAPDSRMRQVAASRGFQYTGRARMVTVSDFDHFDLIIAMDTNNRTNLERVAPNEKGRQKIHLMREYDPEGRPTDSVPDPYYGGVRGFENAFDIVKRSCTQLFETLEDDRM